VSTQSHPQARSEGLVVRELPDEVLVYDLERHEAHCLNQTAAAVWRACDGERTPAEIGFKLAKDFGTPIDEDVVWLALDELSTLNLLETPVVRPEPGLSRAQLMRRGGLVAAAIALPAAVSLAAPSAANAVTCARTGMACGGANPVCCDGCTCIGSVCQGTC